MDEAVFMSNIAYKYFTQLDSLDLSDLEILFGKISSLIFSKKTSIVTKQKVV